MPTLEDKIKAILEGHKKEDSVTEEELNESIEDLEEKEVIKTKSGTTITDDDDSDSSSDDDSDNRSDDSDEGGSDDNEEDDGETDVSKENKVKVNEGSDPFGKLTNTDGSETGSSKTAKIKAGLGRKDGEKGSLKMSASADKQDDNGDNARIKAGAGKKDSGGKLSDGKTSVEGDNEANKKNNVDKNPVGVKEHIDAIMNGEELSEEFRTKVETIFEAAVEQAAEQRINELKEQFDEELTEAVEEVKAELVEQVDGFLNTIVEQWVEDNAVALESAMKVEVVNSFIDGLKDLFKEHYFDIPEDKLDIVEDQASQIEEMTMQLEDLVAVNEEIQDQLNNTKKKSIVEQVGSDLTKVEQEKFAELTEKVGFDSEEDFTDKVKTIKENYFPKAKGGNTIPGSDEPTKPVEQINSYVEAIAKNLKF